MLHRDFTFGIIKGYYLVIIKRLNIYNLKRRCNFILCFVFIRLIISKSPFCLRLAYLRGDKALSVKTMSEIILCIRLALCL